MSPVVRRLRELFIPPVEFDPGMDVRRLLLAGLAVIGIGVVGIGGWAMFAPLSGAVIAQGFVKVDLNRKVVQHQEGGIVRQILVRDGARVKQGEPLIVIEDVRVDAAFDLLRTQLDAERARVARLTAEAARPAELKFPADILARAQNPKTAESLEREKALYLARRRQLEDQLRELGTQVEETRREAAALGEQIAAEQRALGFQKEELAANEQLSKTRQRESELKLRQQSAVNAYRQSATDELKDATARSFDLEERLRPTRDASERQRIVAPIAGEVVGLRVNTAGAVIGPRDVLMEIVPEDKRLIVEARIRTEDVNYVRVGSPADLRLTAYKQRNTPLVEGTVSYMSGDSLQDNANTAPYYMAHIEVSAQALAEAGNLRMQAGMPAEIYIRTDSRTALDYLIAPVTAYFRRGMREPL